MSKVITFSRQFPSYHPRAGEPTYFVEQLQNSLCSMNLPIYGGKCDPPLKFLESLTKLNVGLKHHTIRAGHRFKAGDWFSTRVWSGKPYNSKQIIIAPDIQVKKVWDFTIKKYINDWYMDFGRHYVCFGYEDYSTIDTLAKNDGLARQDFLDWFQYPKPFEGQIICWNENIHY
jgi:hypothetical protein